MKKTIQTIILAAFFAIIAHTSSAQCSLCSKTAQQLGEKPARALNGAIVYLAAFPLALIGYIGYRWYDSQRDA